MANSKRGAKDSATKSFEQHEMKSVADKTDLSHWAYAAAIKRKLNTKDPKVIEDYIANLKATGSDLVITHEELFGGEEDEN